ncbi:hypothetical protein [Microbacterium azadirachtae]|uniref:hypothetical protein n=1 Tax=Microbacterium azadirachtae TaxID=582680 RepID=UPI000891BEA8|nr:hypothetical protein [Microbacterium azadirachtae]SDL43910.1 hypothetical protein SAMN04488593_1086 [Microbacterium azadirachtae]SEF74234.1 hypothetical protein SAMN04488594_1075 [Microbacterium azadirachtae]SEF74983.1 hypothetical protein SAMN04488592_1084 [Microbacterium azadirachtae]
MIQVDGEDGSSAGADDEAGGLETGGVDGDTAGDAEGVGDDAVVAVGAHAANPIMVSTATAPHASLLVVVISGLPLCGCSSPVATATPSAAIG